MVTVDFDFMGEAVRLALAAERYADGGLAIILLDAADPVSEGYLGEWGVLTVSVSGAEEWCREPGHVVIDAGNIPTALVDALAAAGIIEPAGRAVASGMARYPLAVIDGSVLSRMGDRTEVLEEVLGSSVVAEYESDGEDGTFEVETAAGGRPSRTGFGDAGTIGREVGRTICVARGG